MASGEYVPTRTRLQNQVAEKKAKRAAHDADFQRQLESYVPSQDPKIQGSPASTLFICRLAYAANEDQARAEFGKYGTITSARMLKGYAFIVFDSPHAVSEAIQQTSGSHLWLGHRILSDFERARRQPFWKPRRLGGGLGGRFSLLRQRRETARTHQILRKGADSIAPVSNRQQNVRYNSARIGVLGPSAQQFDDTRCPKPYDRRPDYRTDFRADNRSDRRPSPKSDARVPGKPDPRAPPPGNGGRKLRQY